MSSWIEQVFGAEQVRKGGIARRNIQDVERLVGLDVLIEEAKSRGFHLVETGDQVVILCHEGALNIHC